MKSTVSIALSTRIPSIQIFLERRFFSVEGRPKNLGKSARAMKSIVMQIGGDSSDREYPLYSKFKAVQWIKLFTRQAKSKA